MSTVVNEKDVEGTLKTEPWVRLSKVLISEHSVGAKQVSMGINISEPGSGIPCHKHDTSEEALYCVEGHGRLTMQNGDVYDILPGAAFWNPMGVEHTLENIGTTPLKVVWAYAPPLADHLKK
ncbi:MAG: cupin domain-containing protein [Deltaproteobacteria bacterium]|nr:cupin domain-containing protein [Deltaproteobacteria bacterium]